MGCTYRVGVMGGLETVTGRGRGAREKQIISVKHTFVCLSMCRGTVFRVVLYLPHVAPVRLLLLVDVAALYAAVVLAWFSIVPGVAHVPVLWRLYSWTSGHTQEEREKTNGSHLLWTTGRSTRVREIDFLVTYSYDNLCYNVICDFTTCVGCGIYA